MANARRFVFSALRMVTGGVFAFSGFLKLMDPPEKFASVISTYELVTPETAALIARVMPWGEWTLGIFLLAGLWIRPAAVALWVMNTFFIVALASVLMRGIPIGSCGCLGEAVTMSPSQMLVVDSVLWLVLFGVVFFAGSFSEASLDKRFEKL